MRKFLIPLITISLLLGVGIPAYAQGQTAASVIVYNVDTSTFPTITGFVDVIDSNGIFASGLKPEAVSIIENGQPLPADAFTELAIPLQLVVAFNQGEALDARNANGISRFQRVAQVIAQWAQSRPPDLPDDLSLVSQAGPVINHASPADFIVGLQGFQPDMRTATPNLQSLSAALDVVSAQTPRIGVKRAVLFITPQMGDPNLASALEPLIQRAIENRIRVFVWYVDANTTFTTTSAAIFNNLAIQTGGSMFQFSGEERFPDPEVYFAPLRRIYNLSYTSHLNFSGDHTLALQVNLPSGGTVTSEAQPFNLNVQPPNPFPVDPSLQITRQAPEDDPFNTEVLLPETQDIEIIVEFPDGYERPLASTTLYVDGVAADENTTEPFTKFTWDLKPYTTSGEHQLTVEAVDTLGLSKTSMALPVVITVIKPPSGPAAFLAKYRTQLTIGAIVLAGLVLFAILLGGRLRFLSLRAIQEQRRAHNDPLTQPLPAMTEKAATAKERNLKRQTKPVKAKTGKTSESEAAASLVRVNPDGQFAAVPPIPLNGTEILIGTDPVQCTQILDDPSISPVHARIRATDDGGYLLQDSQSIAGTWVNFEPVPKEGYRLEHGDMVNFGQLKYRFMLRTPPPPRTPKIIYVNPE
ncbi:MAG: FHA domain-containing protein [Anaerolineales bacterium]|nr:FHA domain-containing protein [Anaerolineales bacterium]